MEPLHRGPSVRSTLELVTGEECQTDHNGGHIHDLPDQAQHMGHDHGFYLFLR